MDDSWLQDRITETQTLIVNAQSLLSVLLLESTPAQRSYTLNTGQTVVTVTKQNVEGIKALIDGLFNQLVTMEARLNGAGAQSKPGW